MPHMELHYALDYEPFMTGGMNLYGKSLKEIVSGIWTSVGNITGNRMKVSSCTLISVDLALLPYHSIAGLDVRELNATFGYVRLNPYVMPGISYPLLHVVEYDELLDYAIVQLGGSPGLTWGFALVNENLDPVPVAALLHYPMNMPLQISVNSIAQEEHASIVRFITYHDSNYGSSGGSYIAPSGQFFAMHLGMERNFDTMTVSRVALPLQTIIDKYPSSIVSAFAKNGRNPLISYDFEGYVAYQLPSISHDFIDFEKFDRSRLDKSFDYYFKSSYHSVTRNRHRGKTGKTHLGLAWESRRKRDCLRFKFR